jgi:hypothetical protein
MFPASSYIEIPRAAVAFVAALLGAARPFIMKFSFEPASAPSIPDCVIFPSRAVYVSSDMPAPASAEPLVIIAEVKSSVDIFEVSALIARMSFTRAMLRASCAESSVAMPNAVIALEATSAASASSRPLAVANCETYGSAAIACCASNPARPSFSIASAAPAAEYFVVAARLRAAISNSLNATVPGSSSIAPASAAARMAASKSMNSSTAVRSPRATPLAILDTAFDSRFAENTDLKTDDSFVAFLNAVLRRTPNVCAAFACRNRIAEVVSFAVNAVCTTSSDMLPRPGSRLRGAATLYFPGFSLNLFTASASISAMSPQNLSEK